MFFRERVQEELTVDFEVKFFFLSPKFLLCTWTDVILTFYLPARLWQKQANHFGFTLAPQIE